ncbi:MAG: hemerythrin domain-containing protein [Magnetovibrio sp.]|nr:hemerythrin domain-containing protein [Magnetovibrio sp.]
MSAKSVQAALSVCSTIVEHIPDNLLLEPIEYLFADHCRQREMCRAIKALAQISNFDEDALQSAKLILNYLENDFSNHMEDEEQNLFPLLQARCAPEDRFTEILHVLQTEHQRDLFLFKDICQGIRQITQGKTLSELPDFQSSARLFAETHLAHLNWENTVVLDLARVRLNKDDQYALARGMAARRNITLPEL